MAWVTARMCDSVNVPLPGVPRWPLVPKLTSWSGSSTSGRRAWYSRSSAAGSISRSAGGGLPARGETGMACPFPRGAFGSELDAVLLDHLPFDVVRRGVHVLPRVHPVLEFLLV